MNFASEAGLAVLVVMRYFSTDLSGAPDDLVLGWTEVDSVPLQVGGTDDVTRRAWVDNWLETGSSLLATVPSRVLPEADIMLMNPRHDEAAKVAPLVTRPFSFAETLHTPPMLGRLGQES